MRNAALLIVILAVGACSLDHVVVAALDDQHAAGAAGAAGAVGAAGAAGAAGAIGAAGTGGVVTFGGSSGRGGDSVTIITGGTGDIFLLGSAGEGGVTSQVRCSCKGQQAQVCGSDGLTYPDSCSDGAVCSPPVIACWHACPCLDGEAGSMGGMVGSVWLPQSCVSTAQCADNRICLIFTDAPFGTQVCGGN